MRTLRLSVALASALAVGTLSAPLSMADEPGRPAPRVVPLFGKTWCVGEVPATTRCDIRLPPRPEARAEASPRMKAASNLVIESWTARLKQALERRPSDMSGQPVAPAPKHD
jgi:hypothetical protein